PNSRERVGRCQKKRRRDGEENFLHARFLRLAAFGVERLATPSLEKISPARQAQSRQAQIADSSCRYAVNFSSACTTKLFPSRWASAIQIVRPSRCTAES